MVKRVKAIMECCHFVSASTLGAGPTIATPGFAWIDFHRRPCERTRGPITTDVSGQARSSNSESHNKRHGVAMSDIALTACAGTTDQWSDKTRLLIGWIVNRFAFSLRAWTASQIKDLRVIDSRPPESSPEHSNHDDATCNSTASRESAIRTYL